MKREGDSLGSVPDANEICTLIVRRSCVQICTGVLAEDRSGVACVERAL